MLDAIYKALGCSVIISAILFIIFMIYVEIIDLIENNKSKKRLNKK